MFLSCIHIYGQRTCGSELNLTKLQQTDPARYQRVMDLENRIQESLIKPDMLRSAPLQSTITVPVVVHIVYNTSAQNISDAQVNSQIQVLNEDYHRSNADRINTPNAFASVAGDANIQFVLAKKDPLGNNTTGITRIFTSQTKFYQNDDGVKFSSSGGENAWNPRRYLNIWVCSSIWVKYQNGAEKELLGYAQFPSELYVNPNTDGVVIGYKYFGTNGTATSPFNKGRTTTHEVGHWLNLRHIWGDDDNDDGFCSSDECYGSDEVNDTPNQGERNYNCPSFPKTDCCSPSNPGVMFMNYMDYTDDACMNLFTNGQIERMRAVFDTQRIEMLNYSNCYNGIRDGFETGVDCGGNCTPCSGIINPPYNPTCNDNIQNQDETGIDCGGVCPPCGIGGKLNDILIQTHCLCGDAPIPDKNTASMFSGENLISLESIKVAYGMYVYCYNYLAPSAPTDQYYTTCGEKRPTQAYGDLSGGIFFEDKGFQFSPDKYYKITFNYWYNTYIGFPIEFKLTNSLEDKAVKSINEFYSSYPNKITKYSYFKTPNGWRDEPNSIPNSFNIGYVIQKSWICNSPDTYCKNSFIFQPDNYYKQLLISGDARFNVLKIQEMCVENFVFNENSQNIYSTRASYMIQFENINYTPTDAVEFIAGNRIIIGNNVRIAPQNQGSVYMQVDNNVCLNSTLRSDIMDRNISTESRSTGLDPFLTISKYEIDNSKFDGVKLYPNPTTGIVNVKVSDNTEMKTVNIFDISGRMLKNNITIVDNKLDLSHLKNGIYYIKIQTQLGQLAYRVIIKK